MDTRDIAADVVRLAQAGELDAIGETYWADDVVSIEAMDGPMAKIEGIAAVRGKTAWWNGAHEIHSATGAGSYVNGNQFAVRYSMDVTVKESGQRIQMDEIALYTLCDGKIAEERFFY